MDPFSYSDIFDTKGIEYIVVIGFLLLIIPVWRLLNRPIKARDGETLLGLTFQSLRIPQGLLFSRNHTWSHLEKSGVASVGMDDLLLHLTGGVGLTYLKEQQDRVKRGEPIARIIQEGKELLISSPISGKIDRLNTSLEENPSAISQDPYNAWLYRIKPERWQEETRDAMMAEGASDWTKLELDRFKEYLAGAMSESVEEPVLQAGGELVAHPLKELDQEIWAGFQENFLNMKD